MSTTKQEDASRRKSQKQIEIQVPALPKLRGKCTLVTSRLCETKLKSTNGLFDLSFPQEYVSFSSEYNSLHDPHLCDYFTSPNMIKKLSSKGFITEDKHVICSLKEYNEYRRFLENEFMKIRRREEDDVMAKKSVKHHSKEKTKAEKAREEKRNQFFRQQEAKLRSKQRKLRKLEKEEFLLHQRKEAQQLLRKEQFEIQREAEREKRKLLQYRNELAEELKKKKALRRTSQMETERLLLLQEMRQQERLKHAKEMEEKWQRWENHSVQAKLEAEEKMRKQEEEKKRKMLRREKIFKILQQSQERKHDKMIEENHRHMAEFKCEADKLERQAKDKKCKEVEKWKQDFEKKRQAWVEKVHHSPSSIKSSDSTDTAFSINRRSSSSTNITAAQQRQVQFLSRPVIIPRAIKEEDTVATASSGKKTPHLDIKDLAYSEDEQLTSSSVKPNSSGNDIVPSMELFDEVSATFPQLVTNSKGFPADMKETISADPKEEGIPADLRETTSQCDDGKAQTNSVNSATATDDEMGPAKSSHDPLHNDVADNVRNDTVSDKDESDLSLTGAESETDTSKMV